MEYKSLNSISNYEMISLLKQVGNYLTTRIDPHYYIKLYSMQGSFVEVWSTSHLPWEGIVKIKVLNCNSLLEPYLSKELYQRVAPNIAPTITNEA